MTRVLIVDGDVMVARVHRGFVERMPGFTVVGMAYTAADALAAAMRLQPDLILLEMRLPDMSGLEVLRRLRETPAPVYVLVVTTARDVDTICAAMRSGVVHYMIKPFSFDALRDRLKRSFAALDMLAVRSEVRQEDVDRFFGATAHTLGSLPKGLTRVTAQLVTDVLQSSPGDMSAGECAMKAGLSRSSTRRYLEYFVQCGTAEVRMRYGSAGRPEHRYCWIGGSPSRQVSEPR